MSSDTSDHYLSKDQQDLLLAALNSNAPSSIYLSSSFPTQSNHLSEDHHYMTSPHFNHFVDQKFNVNSLPTSISSSSGMNMARASSFDGVNSLNDISPLIGELDFPLDLDGNYEYIPGYGNVTAFDGSDDTPTLPIEHEKRKIPPTNEGTSGSQEGENKKRGKENGEEKIPKKPGRKPLTSEPTSKRKAQNRAAQRAFRERKEKHLKDLEEKVAELEKESETANKENTILRAEIEKLQAELAEYRNQLNDSKSGFSSILDKGSNGGFEFEFPMFGLQNKPSLISGKTNGIVLNGGIKVGPGAVAESQPLLTQLTSTTKSINRPSSSAPVTQQNISSTHSNIFSPSVVGTMQNVFSELSPINMSQSHESKSGSRQQTPGTYKQDSSSSPSASTVSHYGAISSCVTSPESNMDSPAYYKSQVHIDTAAEEINVISGEQDEPGFYSGALDDGEASFCEKLGAIACGNPRNPVPLPPDSKLLPNLNDIIPRPDPTSIARRNGLSVPDATSLNGGGNFNQDAFTSYRDSADNNNLEMSFLDDAFPMFLGSPGRPRSPPTEYVESTRQINADPAKPAAQSLQHVNRDSDNTDDGDDDEDDGVMIGSNNDINLIPCSKIWSDENRDRIQAHPKFVSGEMDMEYLCRALRDKARCSEAGVLMRENDLEQTLSNVTLKCESQQS